MALAIAVVFGVVIGSFLNVVIRRLPEGNSIIRPRSHCPNCKRLIRWYDNVPILSYFLLGGRCRHCNRKISIRYPLVEALSGIVGLLMYDKFGLGIEGMGFGDVKMMAMVGAFLGAPLALLTILIGSLLGVVIGLLYIRFAGKSRQYELPFGTFLAAAGIVVVLYGDEFINWYMDRIIQPSL